MTALGRRLAATALLACAAAWTATAAAEEKHSQATKPEKARPAWVDAKEGLVEEGYQKVLVVGPYSTDQECEREVPTKLEEAVDEYARSRDARLGPRLKISAATLHLEQPRLVRDHYAETISSSVGPMRQFHLRLVFDRKFNRWLDQQLSQIVVARRVGMLGAAGSLLLAGMALAWLWLRRAPRNEGGRGAGG